MIRNRVTPGPGKVLADEYNAFLRNARRPAPIVPGGPVEELYPPLICYVRNDTAFTCDAFTVLGLNGPVITRAEDDVEFRNSITFKGVTPDSDDHKGKYCILQEPIKPGEIGRAVISGVTWAQLNITSADDGFAEIANGVRSSIKTGASGSAKILYKESGTGTNKWGLVYLFSAAHVPHFAILYQPASVTYDAEGVVEDIEFSSAQTSDQEKLEPTKNGGTNYNAIILHEPGIYCVVNDFSIKAGAWSYTTTATNISSAFHWFKVKHTIFTSDLVNQSSPGDDTFAEIRSEGYASCAKCNFVFAQDTEYPGKNPLQVRLQVQMNGSLGETFSRAASRGHFGVFKVANERLSVT